MAKKVLSTIPLFSERCKKAIKLLKDNGYEILEYHGDTVMTSDEIKAVGADVCGVIAGCEEWNDALFNVYPELKVIARFGVGVDCIDLNAAKKHGVKVCNAKGMNCDSVGESTIMFALASLRNLVELCNTTKNGGWMRYAGSTLRGKTYGLVGFGAIAQYVAKLLQNFGVERILAYDVFQNKEAAEKLNVSFVGLDYLLRKSDLISLHIPENDETKRLIGEKELKSMKETAILINVARGPIIDQDALYRALNEKWIAAAAVDVFTVEPVEKDNPLLTLNNLICMPHQAADTYETFESVAYFDAQVIIDVMEGKEPANWLNR